MSEPARRPAPVVQAPPLDPRRINQAYRFHRHRRRERLARRRSERSAQMRFWLVLIVLLGLTVFFSVTIWHEIQRLFGL